MAWTYATLTQAIKDFCEYDEQSFNSNIPTFVRNCEERLLYLVDLDYFRRNATTNAIPGNKYLGLPSDFLSPFSFAVTASGSQTFLLNKDVEYLQEYNPDGVTGVPKYYAMFDTNNLLLSPTPASAYPVEMHYYYKPPSIVDVGTTWLGDNAEQAMLYGSLFEAYTYMKGDADILNLYSQRFTEAVQRLKNFGEGRENVDAYRDGLIRVKAN